MLDPAIVEKLTTVFAKLDQDIMLRVRPSDGAQQSELIAMCQAVAATSPRIQTEVGGAPSPMVHLELLANGSATGIAFRGVPGGHEFTSLILAILNASGKGKLPDQGVIDRIAALRPTKLTTYVSLSCTNCPDVVQAANLIASLNPNISHEMVDGGLAQQEVDARKVQAVPAIFAGDKLLAVGRTALADLIDKIEAEVGRDAASRNDVKVFDAIVLGGGPAGVSAAIYLARKGLATALVAQTLGGQVKETLGIENYIGVKYTEGPRLVADFDAHLRSYPVTVLEHRVVEEVVDGAKKTVKLRSGEVLQAPTLIVATGAKWRELNVPGEKQYLGRGVAFCPHCDGPFYKGKRVAVIGGGNSGVEAAIDLAGICAQVTLLEFADALKADAVLVNKARSLANVDIRLNAKTVEVAGNNETVTGLVYENRTNGQSERVELDGVFVQIGLLPNSAVVKGLVETNRFGEIVVDDKGRTNVPGIYACGDVTTTPYKQIVIAMGDGAKAALAAFEDRMRAVAG